MNLLIALGPTELLFILFVFLLPLIALIDILSGRFEQNDKVIWVLVVLFLNILGAILYFLIGRRRKIRK